jgi:hypothetical protein
MTGGMRVRALGYPWNIHGTSLIRGANIWLRDGYQAACTRKSFLATSSGKTVEKP